MDGVNALYSEAFFRWDTGMPAQRGGSGSLAVELPADARPLTLALRLQNTSESWSGPVLTAYDGDTTACRLLVRDSDCGSSLVFQQYFEQRDTPLELTAPMAWIGALRGHDIVVRYFGPRFELFVDGVLLDEEWPMGTACLGLTRLCIGIDDFEGCVGSVALWNRVLADDQISQLSGGREAVEARSQEILGSETDALQYWRPRGHNTSVGDCMPMFDGERFHLYYLYDRRHHGSKWGFGAHQWAHVSSLDLVHWDHHPMALPITDEMEGSICTGSVFHHQGVYYAFYATRIADETKRGRLDVAESRNGIDFVKTRTEIFRFPEPPYVRNAPYRDPVVFRDESTGWFHMLLTTELESPELAGRGGCLAHLVSRDLASWELDEPIVPGYTGQPECPDHFCWNGWYYLVFADHLAARYRMSRDPMGPWQRPTVDMFDGPQAAVLKTAGFHGNRRIGVAWLGDKEWGGHAVFREITQNLDGTLGTCFVREMVPAAGEPVPLRRTALAQGIEGDMKELTVRSPQGLAAVALDGIPSYAHIRMKVAPGPGASCFGVTLNGEGRYAKGDELRIEPLRQKVGWRRTDSASVEEHGHRAIYGVEGLAEPFELEMIVKDDIIDVCIGKSRTLIVRAVHERSDRMFLFAQDSEVRFLSLDVRPLGRA